MKCWRMTWEKEKRPPTLFTRQSVFKKTQVVHPLIVSCFPFDFSLGSVRNESMNIQKKRTFEFQPVFFLLLSALYSVFRCETRVEKEQKPSTQFLSFSRRKKNFVNSPTRQKKKKKSKFGNWIVDSSKCLIEKKKRKRSIQLNSGELEDLTEWKIARSTTSRRDRRQSGHFITIIELCTRRSIRRYTYMYAICYV